MKANLRRMGVAIGDLKYALATHYHIDHAGLGEEMKREGVPLLVVDVQAAHVALMTQWTKPTDNYVEITDAGNVTISCAGSRALLGSLGIAAEILHTPGHSDDSVSLLLDDGSVFTGDLTPEFMAADNPVALASWRLLRSRGARRIYPGHGPVGEMREISADQASGDE